MKNLNYFFFLIIISMSSCSDDDQNNLNSCDDIYFIEAKSQLVGRWNYVNQLLDFCDKTPDFNQYDTTIIFYEDNRLSTNIVDGYYLGEAAGALVEFQIRCKDTLAFFSNGNLAFVTHYKIEDDYLCFEEFYTTPFGILVSGVFKKEN